MSCQSETTYRLLVFLVSSGKAQQSKDSGSKDEAKNDCGTH